MTKMPPLVMSIIIFKVVLLFAAIAAIIILPGCSPADLLGLSGVGLALALAQPIMMVVQSLGIVFCLILMYRHPKDAWLYMGIILVLIAGVLTVTAEHVGYL